MKKALIVLLIAGIHQHAYSQISHISLLIGKTDSEVSSYLDSLNNLKSNPYYKIKKDVSKDGDLVFEVEYSLKDEEYYTCSQILVRFYRIEGSEICTDESVSGSSQYAQSNLNYVKDNFKYASVNQWEKPYATNANFKIVATFTKTDEGSSSFYAIKYGLEENK